MADITGLLISTMERHVTWDEAPTCEWPFSIDVDVDVTPYRVPVFWQNPPDTNTVYEWENIVGVFNAGRKEGADTTNTISAGTFHILFDTENYRPEPYNVFSDAYMSRRDDGDDGLMLVSVSNPIVMTTGGKPREVSLLDLLAFIGANDARRAGRDADADALIGAIPFLDGGHPCSLTQEQIARVMAHAGEAHPIIVRTGKRSTQVMGAASRHRTWDDGSQYTTAGADNSLTIYDMDGGSLLVDAGTNKMLTHLGSIIIRDGLSCGRDDVLRVPTSYEEILQGRNLPVTKGNRRRVRQELEALKRQAYRWSDSDGTVHDVPIRGGDVFIRRDGTITFTFSPDYINLLQGHNAPLVAVDPLLMTTDDIRYPHAFALGRRLTDHSFMNSEKPNRYLISVASLLANTKSIPSYEDVAAKDRAFTRRIIEPLERNLEYLEELGFLSWWDYCHTNGEPLTDEEQAARLDSDGNETALPYEIAKNCLINYEPAHPYNGNAQARSDARARNRMRDAEERDRREREAAKRQRRIDRKTEEAIAKANAEKAKGNS